MSNTSFFSKDYQVVFILWLVIMLIFIGFIIWGRPLLMKVEETNPQGYPPTLAKNWEKKGRMDMAHLYRGFGYAQDKKWKEAVMEYDAAWKAGLKTNDIPKHIHPVEGYFQYGLELFNAKDWKNAQYPLQRAIEINPENHQAVFYLSQTYQQLGDNTTALRYLLEAYKINPKEPFYPQAIATLYYETKQYKEAIQYSEEAMKLDPSSAGPYHIAGLSYFDSGNPQKAIETYQKGLTLDPKNPDILRSLGWAYKAQNNLELAYQQWKKTAELYPNDWETHLYLGQYWMEKKEWNKAISEFQTTQKLSQDPRAPKLILECQQNLKE